MAWRDPGVTNHRRNLDQSQTVTWGQQSIRVPFDQLRQAGYLSNLDLQFPITATTVALGTSEVLAQPGKDQLPTYQAIQSLRILLQGVAPLYDVTGQDLAMLEYVGNGRNRKLFPRLPRALDIDLVAGASNPNTGPSSQYFKSYAAISGGGSNVLNFMLRVPIPLTEWVSFPDTVVGTSQGQAILSEKALEVGLLTLQNTQQNVQIQCQLNPLYTNTTTVNGSVFYSSTAGSTTPTGTASQTVNLYSDFYDVPANPADYPPGFSQSFVITRQAYDVAMSSGIATVKFKPAGLLMRVLYLFYDTNNNLYDVTSIAAGTTPGQMTFKWGASVIKLDDNAYETAGRMFDRYGVLPPKGLLVHDFFEDATTTDLINTATLTSVECDLKNFPSSVTRVHVIEERMIPVVAGV